MHEAFKKVRGRLSVDYLPGIGEQAHIEDDAGNIISINELLREYDYKVCNHAIRIAIVEENAGSRYGP